MNNLLIREKKEIKPNVNCIKNPKLPNNSQPGSRELLTIIFNLNNNFNLMRRISKKQTNNHPRDIYSIIPKFSNYDKEIAVDNVNAIDREEIERKLKEIDNKIEDLGKICDKKKLKSYEDYNNVLRSNKAQFAEELTKLNFKLMEAIKQNTREDFLNKLKKDLYSIRQQVYEKDKEVQGIFNNYKHS